MGAAAWSVRTRAHLAEALAAAGDAAGAEREAAAARAEAEALGLPVPSQQGGDEEEGHDHGVGHHERGNAGVVAHEPSGRHAPRPIPPPMAGHRIILFDIDGTLVTTGGAGAVAWRRAFEELHGIPADIGAYTDAGMTDPDVGARTFEAVLHRKATPDELAQLVQRRLEHLPEAIAASEGYRVLPGVPERLRQLSRAGHLLGLITGNGDGAAHIKLFRGDLNRWFSFGAYATAGLDRAGIVRQAVAAARRSWAGTCPTARSSSSATRRSTSRPRMPPAAPRSASPPASTTRPRCARRAPTTCWRPWSRSFRCNARAGPRLRVLDD